MIPKIRGTFEVKVVTGIRKDWFGCVETIKTTIPLHFYPIDDKDIEMALELQHKVKVDILKNHHGNGRPKRWDDISISALAYVALDKDEKKQLESLQKGYAYKFIDELKASEKRIIVDWILKVSEDNLKGKYPLTRKRPDDSKLPKYIKCEYCDSWVETTHINCPNCSAPIKRR